MFAGFAPAAQAGSARQFSLGACALPPLALASFYDCGKAPAFWPVPRNQNPKETLSSMIRNQKPPAVHQQMLFPPVVQQMPDLTTDKQRELQTAVAELLLNAFTGDDSIQSGETHDESQAHA